MNYKNLSLPYTIDDCKGAGNIINLWKSHYSDLFNCIKDSRQVDDVFGGVVLT